jgi:hypothetical protein
VVRCEGQLGDKFRLLYLSSTMSIIWVLFTHEVLFQFEEGLDTYDDEKKSFIQLSPHAVSRHQESVSYFPIPNVPPRRSMPSRLVTFCANLRHH